MGDSFFGFNTNLPPLTEDDIRTLSEQGKNNSRDSDYVQHYENIDADVYDFETLRHELGVDDEEKADSALADQLIEEGDDYNNVTFGDAPVGQDFDFAGSTQRFSSGITEEEAFFAKRRPYEDQQVNNSGFRNPWATPSVRPSSGLGRGFGEASPMTSSKSIWGNFGAGLSPADNTGFSSLSGSQNSLSPFSNANRQIRPQQPFTDGYQQQQQPRPVTLEDIEADIQRQQAGPRYHQSPMTNGKTISLAELEAALGARSQPQQQQQPEHGLPPFAFNQPDPMQLLAMKQQQEKEKEVKQKENTRKSQYDGLMTQHDKDLVNRIQLSQLASGDPYADDFYYQVYSSLRQRAGIPLQSSVETSRNRGRREENMMQRMQQQLQRIVNDAKRRPKQTQVTLEGALGKITTLTVRNPRQVLQVPQSSNEPTTPRAEHKVEKTTSDKRYVLKIIEDMYTVVLELEQMRRQGPPQPRPDDDDDKDRVEAFNEKYAAKVNKLWTALRLSEPAETPFLINMLSVSKGKKLIPRIVRQLNHDQNLALLTVFVSNFSQLQVCRHVIYPGTAVANVDEAKKQKFVQFEDVELFMNATAPPLLAFIAEAPYRTVTGLLQLILEKNNVLLVAQTKPGLAFLTMLLSRAEILKQGGGSLQGLSPPTMEDVAHWQELYSMLFNVLKGRYLSIFPSMYYLVSLNPNTPLIQLSFAVDDMYVWQFMAAMAVGASMDQQHVLVTEVRDRVMENIVLAKRHRLPLDQANHRISNVNLFLHALGLDASQVSVPM